MKFSKITSALSGKNAKEFLRCSNYSPTALSLQTFLNFGRKAKASESYAFLRKELPVRLANIMREIHLLPDKLHETSYVSEVSALYEKSFVELIMYENLDESNEKTVREFTECIGNISERHADVVKTMALGVMEVKERGGIDHSTDNQLQYFLDRFYLNRISIRMLINQHVSLFGKGANTTDLRYVGMIDPDTNVLAVIRDAYYNAATLCYQQYDQRVPPMRLNIIDRLADLPPNTTAKVASTLQHRLHTDYVHIQCQTPQEIDEIVGSKTQTPVRMTYVPTHLHHMLFEIIKNAMRAVVEHHYTADTLPSIKILVCGGDENITIKVFDNGGGIPRSLMDQVFKYTFTTAETQLGNTTDILTPMAGYGYGLPVSRLYARYFNGDLHLSSVEGFGTDAIIYLCRSAAKADELLPIFNKTSARQYSPSGIPAADWSNPEYTTGLYTPLKWPNHS